MQSLHIKNPEANLCPGTGARRSAPSKTSVRGRVLSGKEPDQIQVIGGMRCQGKDTAHIHWLVDTRAEKFISHKTFEKHLQGVVPLRSVDIRMFAINGSSVPVYGKCELEVVLHDHEYAHQFIVADIDEEAVLGYDFLQRYQCVWEWNTRTLIINEQESPCTMNGGNRRHRVIIADNRQVPAYSEAIVEGWLHQDDAPSVGLVTGQKQFQDRVGLGVARTLVNRRGRRIPVRIINAQAFEKWIYKGTEVATFQEVEVLDPDDPETTSGRIRGVKQDGMGSEDPEFLSLIERSVKGVPEELQEEIRELISSNRDVFLLKGEVLGHTEVVQHQIPTGEAKPLKQRPRREPLGLRHQVQKELESMMEQGVIEPSQSAWASPIVLVKKKDGSLRFCVDYRRLNDVTVKDAYPLPLIQDNLEALNGAKYFSTMDLASGYWQVGVAPEDREKTAFCTRYGLFQFTVMPFGLCNAPGTFERLMEQILQGLQWETLLIYLDDVIVFSRTSQARSLDSKRFSFV